MLPCFAYVLSMSAEKAPNVCRMLLFWCRHEPQTGSHTQLLADKNVAARNAVDLSQLYGGCGAIDFFDDAFVFHAVVGKCYGVAFVDCGQRFGGCDLTFITPFMLAFIRTSWRIFGRRTQKGKPADFAARMSLQP